MNTLLLKLIVTPVLIGAASLAGRRWGETLSGWFIWLPLTSGPGLLVFGVRAGDRVCRRGGARLPGGRCGRSRLLPGLRDRGAKGRLDRQPRRRDARLRSRRGLVPDRPSAALDTGVDCLCRVDHRSVADAGA